MTSNYNIKAIKEYLELLDIISLNEKNLKLIQDDLQKVTGIKRFLLKRKEQKYIKVLDEQNKNAENFKKIPSINRFLEELLKTSDNTNYFQLSIILHASSVLTTEYIDNYCRHIHDLLSNSETIVKLDFYILSMWLLRFGCTYGCRSEAKVRELTNQITTEYKTVVMKELNINDDLYMQMFSNRMSFYDQLCIKCKNSEEFLKNLLAEFAIIVQHDMIHKGYEPFDFSSPLPLYGFDIVMQIELCVTSYLSEFTKSTEQIVQDIRKYAQIEE